MLGKLHECSQQLRDQLARYELTDLLELTYAYRKRGEDVWFNSTLLSEFAECSVDMSPQKMMSKTEGKVDLILQLFQNYQNKFAQIDNPTRLDRISLHRADYAQDILHIIKLGVPFEIEKAGGTLALSKAELQSRVMQIGALEQKWFGPPVQLETFEVSRSVAILRDQLTKKGDRLTISEQKKFQQYINQAKQLQHYHSELEEMEHPSWIMDDREFFQQQIPREVYTELFELALHYYQIDIPVVVDERSAIYDGRSAMHIPAHEGYAELSLQKVIELVQHEIETHYLIQENTKQVLGKVRGGASLLREEGLAKFNEEVINGATLSSFDISASVPQILMGEILAGDDFKEFMRLYWKMQGSEDKATGYWLRRKRNYPIDFPGVQHKDTTYGRGRFAVRSYLMSGGSYESLYLAKVNFEDMKLLMNSLTSQEKAQLIYPDFLAERVLYHFLYHNDSPQSFSEYLLAKWPFLDTHRGNETLNTHQKNCFDQIIALLER